MRFPIGGKLMKGKVKDPGSALTHFIAMILACLAAVPLLIKAASVPGMLHVTALSIFIVSMILLYDEQKALPKTCKNVLEVSADGVAAYDYTDDDRAARTADSSMFYREDPERVFKSLADVRLDVVANKSALPEQLTLFEMLGIGKPRHMDFMNRWKNSNPTKSLAVPIGVDSEGSTIYLDIHEKAHGTQQYGIEAKLYKARVCAVKNKD